MSHDRTVFSVRSPPERFRPTKFMKTKSSLPSATSVRLQRHVLVIPRKHIATLSNCTEADAPLLGRMLVLVARLADELGVAYTGGETGFRTVINTGPGGGQEVYHLHAHILAGPRPWREWGDEQRGRGREIWVQQYAASFQRYNAT